MNCMEKLRKQLDELIDRLSNSDEFRSKLEDLKSVYPFSEYEYIISHLLAVNSPNNIELLFAPDKCILKRTTEWIFKK